VLERRLRRDEDAADVYCKDTIGPVLQGIFVFNRATPRPVPNCLKGKSLSFSRDMGTLFSYGALLKGQEYDESECDNGG